jgi:hypothetical protein
MSDKDPLQGSSLGVYSIFDSLARSFGPLFVAPNDKVACRCYRQSLDGAIADVLDDLHLYCLGWLNQPPKEPPIDTPDLGGILGAFDFPRKVVVPLRPKPQD